MSKLIYGPRASNSRSSRYSAYRPIVNVSKNLVYLESPNKFIPTQDKDTVYHVVEAYQEGRLDIISNIYYGTPVYSWAIAWANNLIDPLTVISGTILAIPSIESLSKYKGPLSIV